MPMPKARRIGLWPPLQSTTYWAAMRMRWSAAPAAPAPATQPFSFAVICQMAPVGQTSEQSTQLGSQ